MIEAGCSVVAIVADLLRRHSDVQYVRLRTFPSKRAPQLDPAELTLDRALRHKRDPEILVRVPEPVSENSLRTTLAQHLSPGHMLGLCSRFEMRSGNSLHALLVDFRIRKSATALATVKAGCNAIGFAGWVIETTNSYHFYGDHPVDEREWLRFMGRWLLLETIVDVRYVGHCIIELISCLRLTADDTLREPTAVARIDGG